MDADPVQLDLVFGIGSSGQPIRKCRGWTGSHRVDGADPVAFRHLPIGESHPISGPEDFESGQQHGYLQGLPLGIDHLQLKRVLFIRLDLGGEPSRPIHLHREAVDPDLRGGSVLIQQIGLLDLLHFSLNLHAAVEHPSLGIVIARHGPGFAIALHDKPVFVDALFIHQKSHGRLGALDRQPLVGLARSQRVGVAFDHHLLLGITPQDLRRLGQHLPGLPTQPGRAAFEGATRQIDGDHGNLIDPDQAPRAGRSCAVRVSQLQLVLVDPAAGHHVPVLRAPIPLDRPGKVSCSAQDTDDFSARVRDFQVPVGQWVRTAQLGNELHRLRQLTAGQHHHLFQIIGLHPDVRGGKRSAHPIDQDEQAVDAPLHIDGAVCAPAPQFHARARLAPDGLRLALIAHAEVGFGQQARRDRNH